MTLAVTAAGDDVTAAAVAEKEIQGMCHRFP